MLVVEVNYLYIVLLVNEVGLSPGQYAPGPHLVDAEGQMLAAMYSHENNVIIPTTKKLVYESYSGLALSISKVLLNCSLR